MIKVNNHKGTEVWLVPTARHRRHLLRLGCLKEPLALSLPRAAAITLQQVNDCSGWAELFDVSVFPVNVSVICPSLCSAPIYDWKQTPAAISTTFSGDTLTRFWWSGWILRDGTKTPWIFIPRGCIVSYRFPVTVNILPPPHLDLSYVLITTRGIVLLKNRALKIGIPTIWNSPGSHGRPWWHFLILVTFLEFHRGEELRPTIYPTVLLHSLKSSVSPPYHSNL